MSASCVRSIGAILTLAIMAPTGAAADGWKQVGFFRSDTRNISVGDKTVRVVSVPDVKPLNLTDEFQADSIKIARAYPGWDYHSDLAIFYHCTPEGFQQDSFRYASGLETKPLAGDPIEAHPGVFDHRGDRRAQVPQTLRTHLGSADVVAARSADWDGDGETEWVVAAATAWDSVARAATLVLYLCEPHDGGWQSEAVLETATPVRAGPLEVRDATGDGQLDIVFRCFHTAMGHYWVDAHIISRDADMAAVAEPIPFDPGLALSPVMVR